MLLPTNRAGLGTRPLRGTSRRRALRPAYLAALLCMCWLPLQLHAEILVLVQGYLGDGDSWRRSGITRQLREAGWADGGHLDLRRSTALPVQQAEAPNLFFTLSLPTEAPLMTQQEVLGRYIDMIRPVYARHSLLLAGHSAGGVVARLYMVRHPKVPVSALITIASPHLGTESAELGAAVGQSPLGWVLPLLGADTVNRSQALFQDLSRERPQSLLFWLNRQPHPSARYVSIVRRSDELLGGDIVVPTWSQDMNNVPTLRGHAERLATDGGHHLDGSDGRVLIRVLEQLSRL